MARHEEPGLVDLKGRTVTVYRTSEYPERVFHFMGKNSAACGNDRSRFYKRQRRGARVTWFEWAASLGPRPVADFDNGLDAQLRLAHSLMEDATYQRAIEKFRASAKKAKDHRQR
jgi:hypothetical protein